MNSLKIYDPAMCCSTGVCGTTIDPELVKLATNVAFLKNHGVQVERFNLGHQPEAFTQEPLVLAAMGNEAENLPIYLVNGEIVAKGCYPSRATMASWFDLQDEGEKPRTALRMSATCGNGSPSDGSCC